MFPRSLFIFLIMFVAMVPQAAAGPRARRTPAPEASVRTTLRPSDLAVVLGRSRGQQEVRHVSVMVRNVGRSEAQQVQVVARVPGGPRVLLRGPKSIRPGGEAIYLSSAKTLIIGAGRVTVEAACLECR